MTRGRIFLISVAAALVLALVAVVSCAKGSRSPADRNARESSEMAPPAPPVDALGYAGNGAPMNAPARAAGESSQILAKARMSSPQADKDSPASAHGEGRDAQAPEAKGEENPYEKDQRMIHYDGYAKLRVTQVRETLDQAVAVVNAAGGYVESLSASQASLRVPVEKFQGIYAQMLKLGDVLQKSVTAEDVTDAFTSVDLRLQTSKATRERLIQLLAQARTPKEKLELISQIKALTEQIDDLETQLKTLSTLAAFSRITLELVPREALSARPSDEEVSEFRWIQQLSPFRRDIGQEGGLLKLEVPRGMVALNETRHFTAESADGAVYWSAIRPNVPRGDTDFWIDALKSRLGAEFASAEVKDAGDFKVLRLVDRSEAAYRYLVAVRAHGDKLELIEVFYPGEAQEQRYGEATLASIRKGSI